MKKIILSSFIWVLTFAAGTAQTSLTVRLDSLFNRLAEKNKAMGSVALMKDGKIMYTRAIGYCSTEDKLPASSLTRYRIGSISKVFTATMIFQLEEEGKLSTEATLGTYFPQIPNADHITINQMLSHHSGIHSFTDDSLYTTYMTLPKTHEEMLQIIAGSKPDFEPGAKAAYSNSNFVLLGYILEKVTGKTYSELLNTRIVKRIGLKNTYYGGKTSPEKQEAWSYSYLTDWIKSSETDMSIPGGAGALVSTPSDLTTFIHALFSGKLVSAASLDNMKTMTDGIGKGLFQFPFETRKAFGHSGGIDAFASSLTYFPDDDLALAYCTNGNSYPMNEILIGVLSIYFNRPYKIPTFKKVEIVSEQLDKYTGLYTSKDIPLKITIAKKDNILTGQATGQPVFPLEASAMHTFKFEPAGIVIEFDPDNKAFILKQGGMSFHYTLEVTP
jgi:CubicO group peptidase (beta-lactamase class C family)